MKTHLEDPVKPDEFQPIELGSVTEETLGVPEETLEYQIRPNSRD